MQKITKKIHIFYVLMVVAVGVALTSMSSTVSSYVQNNDTSSSITAKNITSAINKVITYGSANKTTMTIESVSENSKIKVIVIFEVKEGNKQKALDTLASLADLAKKREGIISYNIYSSTENPNEILIDQLWSSKAAFDKHYNSSEANKARQILSSLSLLLENETFTEINNLHA